MINVPGLELEGFPPKVFLIGAQKAGTTFLANLLEQHPALSVASPKEPHYFTQHREAGLDWYRQFFPRSVDSQILIDASPSYSAAPMDVSNDKDEKIGNPYVDVPRRISVLSPESRLIYLVRDPVKRIHSGYWHAVRTGAEDRPIRKAVGFGSHYRRVSDYYGQLQLYLEIFSLQRILIIRFEDLVHDPAAVVYKCTRFLGIEGLEEIQTAQSQNRSHLYSVPGRVLNFVLAPAGGMKAASKLARVLPDFAKKPIERFVTSPIPAMEPDLRLELLEAYRPMAERFERDFGVKLHPWAAE